MGQQTTNTAVDYIIFSTILFFHFFFLFKGKMISALSLCFIVLIPVLQGDSSMDGFSGMLADEKPTANGGGESDAVKDVSSKPEARRVSVLKELGRLHRNKAVAFLRQDYQRQDWHPRPKKESEREEWEERE